MYLQTVTMIVPIMARIDISTVSSTHADLVFYQVDLAWFTRYLLPSNDIEDWGNEFLAEFVL